MGNEQSKYLFGNSESKCNLNESNLQGKEKENWKAFFEKIPSFPNNYQNEEEISDRDLYFNNTKNKKVPSEIKFTVNQESYSSKNKSTDYSKNKSTYSNKFGRKKKFTFFKVKNNQIHDKYCADNILRKVQIHYFNFIFSFVNAVLEKLNIKQKFLNIKHKFKSNIKKGYIDSLKNEKIYQIISKQISTKYRKKIKNMNNKEIYEKVKDNNILGRIFNESYIDFFKKIYYKTKKEISLDEYGLDKDIILSKNIKTFEDLLNDIKSSDINKEYIKAINNCVTVNYLD